MRHFAATCLSESWELHRRTLKLWLYSVTEMRKRNDGKLNPPTGKMMVVIFCRSLSLSLAHFFRLTFPQWKRRTYTHLYTYQNQHNLRLKLFALYYPAICVSNEGMSQFSYFKWFEWKIWREIINDLWYKLFELVANKNLFIFIVFKTRASVDRFH